MASLFPFTAPSPFFTRTKRKMSGVAIALDIDDVSCSNGSNSASSETDGMSGASSSVKLRGYSGDLHADAADAATTKRWFCALCRSVDVREVLGFAIWKLLSLLIVVLAVADWIFFFKFVVAPAVSPQTRVTNGALWSALTLSLLAFRSAVRAKCGADVRSLADHLEIFIAVSLVMVFSTNVAFSLHVPAAAPLRDLGFMLVPAQAIDSPWRPLSDILTAATPVLGLLQTAFMTRANRCRVIATFFRVATVAYALRMLTVSLTSLPGPAPHCRPGSAAAAAAPQTWIDIVTRVGPMYGQFDSCGDLIFSGHMAYTNSALLLYLRTTDRYFPRFARIRWAIGGMFLLTLAGLCIAGRKHYSVDVVLGVMISTLVYFHFEHSWVPACVAQQSGDLTVRQPSDAFRHALAKQSTAYKTSEFEVVDDNTDVLRFQQQQQQHAQLSTVDYLC